MTGVEWTAVVPINCHSGLYIDGAAAGNAEKGDAANASSQAYRHGTDVLLSWHYMEGHRLYHWHRLVSWLMYRAFNDRLPIRKLKICSDEGVPLTSTEDKARHYTIHHA